MSRGGFKGLPTGKNASGGSEERRLEQGEEPSDD
jgi:hypothetical protein